MAAQRPPTGLDPTGLNPFSVLQYLAGNSFNGTIPPHMAHLFGPTDSEAGYMYTMPPPIPTKDDQWQEVDNGAMTSGTDKSRPLDVQALHERLQTLGLHNSSDSLLPPAQAAQRTPLGPSTNIYDPRSAHPFSPASAQSKPGLASAYQTKPASPARLPHLYPPVAELRPSDSISVYKPAHRPSAYITPGSRRGGTNVDRAPEEDNESEYEQPGTQAADWETHNYAPSDAPSMERMTMGRSEWTTGTLAGNMYTMRDRLVNADMVEKLVEQEEEQNAMRLSSALARLEMQEDQIRELKANLIAQQVAKSQMERDTEISTEDYRDCKNELASAIRALRRAREENKKTDEERRRLARCFEETKTQLFKYHEELKVRDARAKGREEGRAEAWQEAERWMGNSPPIPVDPVQSLPQAVLHQTPQAFPQQLYQQTQQAQKPAAGPPTYQIPLTQLPHGQTAAPQVAPPQNTTPRPFQQSQQHAAEALHPAQVHQPTAAYTAQPPYAAQHAPLQPQHTTGHISPQPLQPQHTANVGLPQPSPTPQLGQVPAPLQPQHTAQAQGYPQMPGGYPPHQQHGATPAQMPGPHGGPTPIPMMYHGEPIPIAVPVPVPVHGAPPAVVPVGVGAPIPVGPLGGTPFALPPGQAYHPSQSVPHHPTHLPVQPPTRAGTVINVHQGPPSAHRRHASESIPRQKAPTTIPNSIRAPAPISVSRHHAAESYLDRAEHDPRVQQMLSGAPAKTIHASAISGHDDHRGLRSQDTVNKPLPTPGMDSLGRGQTLKAPTSASIGGTGGRGHTRRFSLMEGLHAHSHSRSHLADEGPYPVFPRGGRPPPSGGYAKAHSRQSSFASVNPANYALPVSAAPSLMQTPGQEHDQLGRHSVRTTPAAKSGRSRSRMASALRGGTSIGEGELSNIEEEPSRVYPAMNERNKNTMGPQQTPGRTPQQMEHQTSKIATQPHQGSHDVPMQHMQHTQQMPPPQQRQPPAPQRYAPSMPPMRSRPTPRMPAPLGASGGAKAGSEPHQHNPQAQRHQLANMYGQDLAAAPTDRLAPAGDRPDGAHDQYVPPGLAPQAVSGGVEDASGPRHSALGLDFQSPKSHRTTGTNMKAPTIMIQPPSSRDDKSRGGVPTRFPSPATVAPVMPHSPDGRILLDTPPAEKPSRRQTTIITEYFDPPTPPAPLTAGTTAQSHPSHDVPLPKSRSHAPTVYTKSPGATTMGMLSPPDTIKSGRRVNIIDYAMRQPLPPSRPTTMFVDPSSAGSAPRARTATVHTDDPDSGRSKKQSIGPGNSNGNGRALKRKPVPQDPRQVPLPPSRAPTNRAKGSQYAATVATIEEVTEEESGMENLRRRR